MNRDQFPKILNKVSYEGRADLRSKNRRDQPVKPDDQQLFVGLQEIRRLKSKSRVVSQVTETPIASSEQDPVAKKIDQICAILKASWMYPLNYFIQIIDEQLASKSQSITNTGQARLDSKKIIHEQQRIRAMNSNFTSSTSDFNNFNVCELKDTLDLLGVYKAEIQSDLEKIKLLLLIVLNDNPNIKPIRNGEEYSLRKFSNVRSQYISLVFQDLESFNWYAERNCIQEIKAKQSQIVKLLSELYNENSTLEFSFNAADLTMSRSMYENIARILQDDKGEWTMSGLKFFPKLRNRGQNEKLSTLKLRLEELNRYLEDSNHLLGIFYLEQILNYLIEIRALKHGDILNLTGNVISVSELVSQLKLSTVKE